MLRSESCVSIRATPVWYACVAMLSGGVKAQRGARAWAWDQKNCQPVCSPARAGSVSRTHDTQARGELLALDVHTNARARFDPARLSQNACCEEARAGMRFLTAASRNPHDVQLESPADPPAAERLRLHAEPAALAATRCVEPAQKAAAAPPDVPSPGLGGAQRIRLGRRARETKSPSPSLSCTAPARQAKPFVLLPSSTPALLFYRGR